MADSSGSVKAWLKDTVGMKSGQIKSLEEPFLSLKEAVEESETTKSGLRRLSQSERMSRMIEASCDLAEDKNLLGEKTTGCVSFLREHKEILATVWRVLTVVAKVYLWLYTRLVMVIAALPQNILMMLFGLTLSFFGGTYVATLAAAEAFRTVGGETLFKEVKYVWAQVQAVQEASAADDDKDENKTGVADVDEIPPHELLQRKAAVALVTIKEPERLQVSIGALWAAYLAALATLKMQFAFVVSLALGMADAVKVPLTRVAAPALAPFFGAKFKHWATPTISTLINLLAMLVAWYLQMVLAAFYSALRGSRMFANAFLTVLHQTILPKLPESFPEWALCGIQKDKFDPNDTYVDEVVAALVGAGGLWFQITRGFTLPFPFDILLLPVSILEGFLRWQITFFTPDDNAMSALSG
jgi:hypothetical protein